MHTWSRTSRYAALIALGAGTLALIYLGRALIMPLVLSALLAYVLNPLVSFVADRSRLRRGLVVTLFYLVLVLALAGAFIALLPVLGDQTRLLVTEFQIMSEQIYNSLNAGIVILGYEVPVGSLLLAGSLDLSDQLLQSELILQLLGSATTNLVWVLFVIVTTYYLLQDWHRLRDWILDLAPATLKPDVFQLYSQIKVVWQGYLRGQLLLATIIGLLTALMLTAVGLPSAGALGLLAGALDFIPTIGPTIAMLIAAMVAWFTGSTYLEISNGWFTVAVLGIFGLIQGLENVWLRPAVMGRSVRMHPAVVFIAIIGAFSVAGIIGGLVVVPVLASLGIIGHYLRCRFLGIDPWAVKKQVVHPEQQTVSVSGDGAVPVADAQPAPLLSEEE